MTTTPIGRGPGPLAPLALAALLLAGAACSSDGSDGDGSGGTSTIASVDPADPFAEIFELGADRYIGKIEPTSVWTEGPWTRYDFGLESEARCMANKAFRTDVRHGPSDNLIVFLMGGGACLPGLCAANGWAVETGNWFDTFALMDLVVDGEALTTWDVAVVAYCDGSLMAGDIDLDLDGDGEVDRYHRGLANLSAGVDVAGREFPDPGRIVLAGFSGGGYSTIPGTFSVRKKWPGVPIDVINDHGIALAKEGDPAFIDGLLDHWKIDKLIPPSCEGCTADGHLTELLAWQLERDPDLRIALLSSYRDFVIGGVFLRTDLDRYAVSVRQETRELSERFPGRCESFAYEGVGHTLTIGGLDSQTAGGVTGTAWLSSMLNRDGWTSATDP